MKQKSISFDCASSREIDLVKRHSILFANPCKTPRDIQSAKKNGISIVTCDSIEEIEKMQKESYNPNIVLRLAVDDSSSDCPFNAKFGLAPEEVYDIAKKALDCKAKIIGLSFHVGSGSRSPKAFYEAIKTSKTVWSILQKYSLVNNFKILDLGGGWSHCPEIFTEQAVEAKRGMIEGLQPECYIAEPGRFYAAPTHDLYVRVVGKKPRKGGGWRYTLDESIYGQFSCIPFDHARPRLGRLLIDPTSRATSNVSTPATFFGRTCDSLDWIGESAHMEELEVGDWIYAPNMGAYTTATSTEFNGFPKPEVFVTDERPSEDSVNWLSNIVYPLSSMLSVKN